MRSQTFMHAVQKMFRNAIDKNAYSDYNNNRNGKNKAAQKIYAQIFQGV